MKADLLVIGCGNEWASDDAVGLQVIRSLKDMKAAKEVELPDGVELIEAGTPGLNLLDLWDRADRVIIVDAVKSGAAPGTVHSFDASLLPPRDVMPVSSHGVNIIDAVELGRLLGRLPAQLTVIGVEILSEQPFHVGLTPEVEAAVPRARERVLEAINQHLGKQKE
jgi:hydrogenase maturation protease